MHVKTYNRLIKSLIRRVFGYQLERVGPGIYNAFRYKEKDKVWFSYKAQLKTILERLEIDLVLDVGANEGQFVQRLREIYQGEVISFEPVSEPYKRLCLNAVNDDSWKILQLALGETERQAVINISNNTVFSSILETNDFGRDRFGDEQSSRGTEIIQMTTLENAIRDNVVNAESRRIFLKIDTQGYDLNVFRGIGKYGDRVFGLQSEISIIPIYSGMDKWTDSICYFIDASYSLVGLFPVTRDGMRVIEYDCLLIKG